MNLSSCSGMELLKVYGDVLSEMRHRNMIRSKNVTGDLGEYIVVDYYTKTKGLPKLQFAPPSTKNIDAISVEVINTKGYNKLHTLEELEQIIE